MRIRGRQRSTWRFLCLGLCQKFRCWAPSTTSGWQKCSSMPLPASRGNPTSLSTWATPSIKQSSKLKRRGLKQQPLPSWAGLKLGRSNSDYAFVADHPFLLFVRDIQTKLLLFHRRVNVSSLEWQKTDVKTNLPRDSAFMINTIKCRCHKVLFSAKSRPT